MRRDTSQFVNIQVVRASCSLVGVREQDAHTTNLQKRDRTPHPNISETRIAPSSHIKESGFTLSDHFVGWAMPTLLAIPDR